MTRLDVVLSFGADGPGIRPAQQVPISQQRSSWGALARRPPARRPAGRYPTRAPGHLLPGGHTHLLDLTNRADRRWRQAWPL